MRTKLFTDEPAVFAPLCDALITLSHGKSKILLCNGVRSSTRERLERCRM